MASSNGYVINVGRERPEKVIVAQVNKRTGEPVANTQFERYVAVGTHLIVNKCRVWGRRFIVGVDKKKAYATASGGAIEFNTPNYAGEIEFLEWGDSNGSALEIRYLEQSRSLDVEYQENIQKIRIDLDKGLAQLELGAGENKFDYSREALKISFLKVHPQNRDSKSKNPNPEIKGFTFYEITDAMVDSNAIDFMENMIEAGLLVKSNSEKPEAIKNLFSIMVDAGADFGQTNHLSNGREIYKSLLALAQNKGADFNSIIEDYKKKLSDTFELAISHEALDTTKDGEISFIVPGGKKELIVEKSEGKKGEQLEWVLNNFYQDGVFQGLKKLETLVLKLK